MNDSVDVLRTITIWRNQGLTPAEAYEGLIGITPMFGANWADVQAVAADLRASLPDHEPPGGNVISFPQRAGSYAQNRTVNSTAKVAAPETSGWGA